MRVLHVCSELFPLLKTGGLADVAGALPPALAKLGCDGRVLVPGFPAFMQGIKDTQLVVELPNKFGFKKNSDMDGFMVLENSNKLFESFKDYLKNYEKN